MERTRDRQVIESRIENELEDLLQGIQRIKARPGDYETYDFPVADEARKLEEHHGAAVEKLQQLKKADADTWRSAKEAAERAQQDLEARVARLAGKLK